MKKNSTDTAVNLKYLLKTNVPHLLDLSIYSITKSSHFGVKAVGVFVISAPGPIRFPFALSFASEQGKFRPKGD